MMNKFLFVYIYIMSVSLFSQVEKKTDTVFSYDDYIIVDGDSVIVELEEVQLLNKLEFVNDYDKRYYSWFKKKVYKAYPYARIGAEELTQLNEEIEDVSSNRKKKKRIKEVQNYMEDEFSDQLKKLTKTEGRILIKLIHRQTGYTAYDLVKEMRSGWNAFWYNGAANLFSLSLKIEYDPKNVNEDFLIEDILQRAFLNGDLDPQASKLPIDFAEISQEKGNVIHISTD